jgi:hypothetical protein
MKRTIAIVLASCLAAPAVAAAGAAAADPLDRLRALAGDWEGTGMNGKPVHITYTVTAAGSVVMEAIDPGTDHSMITMYHKDGDRLMMTHYCAAGNQPRMRAEKTAADARTIRFAMVDATNLAKPTDGHMVRLALTMDDDTHLTQEWTFRNEGKDAVDTFRLERKK